jgi:hypothetical protein
MAIEFFYLHPIALSNPIFSQEIKGLPALDLIRHWVSHPGAIELRCLYILIYIFVNFSVQAGQY